MAKLWASNTRVRGSVTRAHQVSPSARIPRESLEETVLVVQKVLELSSAGRRGRVPFCAFNGGRDVFVDIGDKSWGVTVCQRWFAAGGNGGGDGAAAIKGDNTLHVGDQFLSAGANDFRARSVGTTAWIASPAETVDLLDELAELMGKPPGMNIDQKLAKWNEPHLI